MFSARPRLGGGVELVNGVEAGRFPLLASRVAQGIISAPQGGPVHVFNLAELEKLQAALELTPSILERLIDALSFVFKQAAFHLVKPEALQTQLQAEGVTLEKAAACAQIWSGIIKSNAAALRERTACHHKMSSLKWSLGARLSSSAQTSQRVPIARLQFELTHVDPETETKGPTPESMMLEMNHDQLYQFYQELERMQGQLDSLK